MCFCSYNKSLVYQFDVIFSLIGYLGNKRLSFIASGVLCVLQEKVSEVDTNIRTPPKQMAWYEYGRFALFHRCLK